MGQSKGKKVKQLGVQSGDRDVFWMSLEEAKQAIADKFAFLEENYDKSRRKKRA